jgi:hypothetical protein
VIEDDDKKKKSKKSSKKKKEERPSRILDTNVGKNFQKVFHNVGEEDDKSTSGLVNTNHDDDDRVRHKLPMDDDDNDGIKLPEQRPLTPDRPSVTIESATNGEVKINDNDIGFSFKRVPLPKFDSQMSADMDGNGGSPEKTKKKKTKKDKMRKSKKNKKGSGDDDEEVRGEEVSSPQFELVKMSSEFDISVDEDKFISPNKQGFKASSGSGTRFGADGTNLPKQLESVSDIKDDGERAWVVCLKKLVDDIGAVQVFRQMDLSRMGLVEKVKTLL